MRSEPGRLAQLQQNARAFALNEGNLEVEIQRVAEALRSALATPCQPARKVTN